MSWIGDFAKNNTNSIITNTLNAVENFGKSAVNALLPNDYEYYLCSFELYDSKRDRVGFLSFVVMPEQISESYSPIQTIVKTHGGIVTTFNPTFAPIDINLSGTFGKKFRLVSNFSDPTKKNGGGLFNINFGITKSLKLNASMGVKSGYGLTKILHHILDTASKLDAYGKPHFLCFNNYAFNTSYVVNVTNYSFSQSVQQNMMWYYTIALKAVGEKPKIDNKTVNKLNVVSSNAIANGLTNVITNMVGF